MKILVACEESQIVTEAFRKLGHDAFSCDIMPCSGSHPEWHIQDDVLNYLNMHWDMIIAHPPCTYLTVTGNRWYNVDKYGDVAIARFHKRQQAIEFFMKFVECNCKRIAIENPIGVMSTIYRKPNQIIQPYMFGDPYEKRTCLWLRNLPELIPTNIVIPEERLKTGKTTMPKWYAEAWKMKPEDRARYRSKTFPGIAEAMAKQWGGVYALR